MAAVSMLGRLRDWGEAHKLGQGDRILVQAHGQAGWSSPSSRTSYVWPRPVAGRDCSTLLSAFASQVNRPDINLDDPTCCSVAVEWHPPQWSSAGRSSRLAWPVRYGWDPSGLGKLLHIVNHRNMRTDGKTWLSKMELPQITMEMPIAWGGDYVQELAVAGSDARAGD